jgi:hypothetical protein
MMPATSEQTVGEQGCRRQDSNECVRHGKLDIDSQNRRLVAAIRSLCTDCIGSPESRISVQFYRSTCFRQSPQIATSPAAELSHTLCQTRCDFGAGASISQPRRELRCQKRQNPRERNDSALVVTTASRAVTRMPLKSRRLSVPADDPDAHVFAHESQFQAGTSHATPRFRGSSPALAPGGERLNYPGYSATVATHQVGAAGV